jgi:long-chain acyl-CoA synthetase
VNLAAALLGGDAAPDAVAISGPQPLTYGALRARVQAAAARVAQHAGPGDRVAVFAGNEPAFVIAYLAILHAGAVAVPLNVASPVPELARELDAVTPVATFVSDAHAARAHDVGDHAGVLLPIGDDAPAGAEVAVTPALRAPGDLAVLLFTAGTAGSPKPAMLTHGSLLANLEQMQAHPGLRVTRDDVVLAVLPLFHVYGLNVVLGLALSTGARVALVEHFEPAATLARVRDDGVTVVPAVPAVYAAWLALDEHDAPRNSFERVRLCVSGAAALPAEVRAGMRDRYGVVVHDGYGLTEASPAVTTTAVAAEPRPGSIGPPLPGVEVCLADSDGNPVLDGDPGEILVRGPNVFAGYWDDDVTTGAVLADGWLHTGDIAVADADGWLTLVDRAKDVIIVSGFNVYPGEVEEALRSHESVEDVAVVGEPHPRSGEQVVAFVVARPGASLDSVDLLRHAGRRLARYKLPTRVEVVDALPRTLAGKVLRRALGHRGRQPDATTNPT